SRGPAPAAVATRQNAAPPPSISVSRKVTVPVGSAAAESIRWPSGRIKARADAVTPLHCAHVGQARPDSLGRAPPGWPQPAPPGVYPAVLSADASLIDPAPLARQRRRRSSASRLQSPPP